MLTIILPDESDYSELTRTYMGIFYSQKFDGFLNTTQTGYAHTSAGIELSLLLKTVYTSVCFCTVQLTFFCFFRSIFKSLYQPRSYCVPKDERIEPLPSGFLVWVWPTLRCSISYYLSMGLDAYFFIRYMSILVLFFMFIGSLNMIILIPINVTGSSVEYSATGLDKLSLSNISRSKVYRLNAHFIMSLITIGFFQWLLLYELQTFVKIRQSFLLTKSHRNSVLSKTVLISNVPPHLQDLDVLCNLFSTVPGGIENIWYLYDYREILELVEEAKEALNILEEAELSCLKHSSLEYGKKCKKMDACFAKQLERKDNNLDNERNSLGLKANNSLNPKFYPPIYFKSIKIPKLERYLRFRFPGFLRIIFLGKRVSIIDWCIKTLNTKQELIDKKKLDLATGLLKRHNKLFVEFQTQTGAYIAHQCLLSQIQGNLDLTLIEIHPKDILWDNIARNNTIACLIEKYFVSLIFISVILLYVIPVSFIGLVSQVPLLTKLIPSLKWIYKFPEEARDTISSILPSLLLAILTDIVLIVFRFLTYFKGMLSGADLELNLQQWYFAFLFVQQFLVVTILSSITVIFKQIVDQPTSIPVLLATNLPKAATFFFQYITLKAFAFCGNNFLRIGPLMLHLTVHKIKDKTPRQKFNRITNLLRIRWGSIYPVYSVFASIGICYCVISPLIAIFVIFILSLLLLYYKYALKYIYNRTNESDTKGKHYPIALLHLYTGIYCLECCLIGIFFLLKNENDSCPMIIQGWVMCIILLATIFGNITIYNRYVKHFSYLPILSDKKFRDPAIIANLKDNLNNTHTLHEEKKLPNEDYLNRKLLFLHPAFKYEKPKIWLPEDPFYLGVDLIRDIESKIEGLEGGSTNGAKIEFSNNNKKITMKITNAPPDYK